MRFAATAAVAQLGLLLAGVARADDVADVRAVLTRFDRAFEALDGAKVAALFAAEPDVVYYGSDVAERWLGQGAIKAGLSADMKRLKSVKIDGQPATVHVRGGLAWFERVLVMNTVVKEGESAIFARATGVAEKRGGEWQLVQLHISVGAPRDSPPHD